MRCAGDRHRAAARLADALGERLAILKSERGLVARGARHEAVRAEARIEEEPVAQRRSFGIVGHTIRRIRRPSAEPCERQAAELLDLLRRPVVAAGRYGEHGRDAQGGECGECGEDFLGCHGSSLPAA